MTYAASIPPANPPTPPQQAVPIVVLGSDALLAASPATPVQLAHACLRAGFATAIPASWGDELIAAGILRALPAFGAGPVIQCSCPIVAHRLLTVGGDLRPALLALVPPPVAVARYIKSVSGSTPTRITYVGSCPGAIDDSIDIRMTPEALIAMLGERGIVLDEQPRAFESIIPPDRRRFYSQPGGLPSAESLWSDVTPRSIVELEGDDLAGDLAQQLLTGKNILIDASTRLGCVCSGAIAGISPRDARSKVVALEPPRSSSPVVADPDSIDLDLPVPAAPRTPVDVLAVPRTDTSSSQAARTSTPPRATTVVNRRVSPVRGIAELTEPQPRAPRPSPLSSRAVFGAVPVARDAEGKSLPRAFVARRRSSPRSVPAITDSEKLSPAGARAPTSSAVLTPPHGAPVIRDESSVGAPVDVPTIQTTPASLFSEPGEDPVIVQRHAVPRARAAPTPRPQPPRQPGPGSLSGRQAIFALIAVLVIALSVGAVVAVFVARSLRDPAPAGTAGASGVPR